MTVIVSDTCLVGLGLENLTGSQSWTKDTLEQTQKNPDDKDRWNRQRKGKTHDKLAVDQPQPLGHVVM